MSRPVVGVLAVQGDVAEHMVAVEAAGGQAITVRRPAELAQVNGLVLPGGESTTIIRLLRTFELLQPLRQRISAGLAVYGSCAGMILLADRLIDSPGQETIGGFAISVRRNAFGRQVDSFEEDLTVRGVPEEQRPMRAVFIRAPWVEDVSPQVQVLASARDHPVVIRQGRLLASSFHPELTQDLRLHQLLVELAGSPP